VAQVEQIEAAVGDNQPLARGPGRRPPGGQSPQRNDFLSRTHRRSLWPEVHPVAMDFSPEASLRSAICIPVFRKVMDGVARSASREKSELRNCPTCASQSFLVTAWSVPAIEN
jgi:hypothetical protein